MHERLPLAKGMTDFVQYNSNRLCKIKSPKKISKKKTEVQNRIFEAKRSEVEMKKGNSRQTEMYLKS